MTPEPLAVEYGPWAWEREATPEQSAAHTERLAALRARGFVLGEGVVVSTLAAVDPATFALGDRSYVAAHAHVTGDVRIGADSSVNVGTAVRGTVTIGDAVRIGAHSSLLGFDHGYADVTTEIFRQPHTSAGITVGDDVWIGAHVLVLDGVRIGDHAIVGAGAVVTKDVPDWAVAVGNPARVVRDRRAAASGGGAGGAAGRARRLGERARAEAADLLAAAWRDGTYRDRPDAAPTVRAHGDAVELADLLLGGPPPQLPREQHVRRLRSAQHPATGLVAELVDGAWPDLTAPGAGAAGSADGAAAPTLADGAAQYHVLSTGYALDLLGSAFAHPVRAVTDLTPAALVRYLEGLTWSTRAWAAGADVDTVGTALTWALRRGDGSAGVLVETTLGWLLAQRDRTTGLWGTDPDGLREPVNGTYRLVRGTFGQWGVDAGDERPLVDVVLRRAGDVLAERGPSACDTLDVVHPLHRAARTARGYRTAEVRAVAEALLALAADGWRAGRGIAFAGGHEPSLQGTEMWLAVAWSAADLLGVADALGYRPRGVHRPGPALDLRRRGDRPA
ncbi:acyltransferase [Cellulomonas endophytica]|uniref:acyltransferase n=1 Tax=Cellulomonas endophytica TaxID=2494735 RepID=UPI00101285B2|nr:acyltransferase [Cellulomonas endophytica]